MNKIVRVLFTIVFFKISIFASSSNNPYSMDSDQQSQENEKEFIAMINTEYSIYLKKKRLKEEKVRKVKLEQLLKIEENRKRVALEIEKYKAEEARKRVALEIERQKAEELLCIEKKMKEKRELLNRSIFATVDISKQRIKIFKGKKHLYTWKVSTGRNGHRTPRGNYKPTYITKMHRSRKYNNAAMPYSVFFYRGYAVHGTRSVSRLGRRASHGCVRLRTSNAKKFYNLIRKYGKKNTKIEIVN